MSFSISRPLPLADTPEVVLITPDEPHELDAALAAQPPQLQIKAFGGLAVETADRHAVYGVGSGFALHR